MGKNHRHSKKLKSEKNKIQIKSKTKFLPKGQNVTNTSFKIRPIVLQEQLKEVTKKINIAELVPKLKHYNDTIKSQTCENVRQFIIANQLNDIIVYMGAILQNGGSLVQDKDRKVRRCAIKMLQTIFEKISTITLRPFFTYILTNLKCAMTHINRNIQEDSLLLLDAILENQSILLAENFDTFLPNFLLLISKFKNKSEHTLSLNLEGKVTSVKWRGKVLTRLYTIIKSLVQNDTTTTSMTTNIDAKNTVFIPIYNGLNETVSKSSNFDFHPLVPLLRDIWLEADEDSEIFSTTVRILSLIEVGNTATLLRDLMKSFPHKVDHEENLTLLELFLNCQKSSDFGIVKFVTNCLKSWKKLSPAALLILKRILLNPNFGGSPEIIAVMLEDCSEFGDILIYMTDKHPNYLGQGRIQVKLIEEIFGLVKKGQELGIREYLKDILENLPQLQIVGEDQEMGEKNFINIFFYLSLDQSELRLFRDFVDLHPDLVFSKHIKNMLAMRLYFRR